MMKIKPPKPQNTDRLAMAASLLQKNTTFREAMTVVRGAYVEALLNTHPNESQLREHYHRCVHSLTDIESALTAFIQNGTLEKLTLDKQEKAKK